MAPDGPSLFESRPSSDLIRPFLIGPEHGVHEQLCLLEIFKLAVWFLIDVFDLGEQLCSRPMGRCSDARNVASAG